MKRKHYILIIGAILCATLLLWIVPRNLFLSGLVEQMYPGFVPATGWARNLHSSDIELIRESLYFLTKRKDPIGVARAIQLLSHPDDYIWLNAALYVGACKRQESVPYLIKALRHTAWRSDAETAQHLRALTGADYGTDFARWQQWWLASHPDSSLDWDSHLGHSPRIAKTK